MPKDEASNQYLEARIAEALATDPRTNALDVQVHVSETEVIISGGVAGPARLKAAERVVSELIPSPKRLVNRLWIQDFQEPTEPETLA